MKSPDVQKLTYIFTELHNLVNTTTTLTHSTKNVTIRRFAQILRDLLNVAVDTAHWMLSLAEKEE